MRGLEITKLIIAILISELDTWKFDKQDNKKEAAINHLKSALAILCDPQMPSV